MMAKTASRLSASALTSLEVMWQCQVGTCLLLDLHKRLLDLHGIVAIHVVDHSYAHIRTTVPDSAAGTAVPTL